MAHEVLVEGADAVEQRARPAVAEARGPGPPREPPEGGRRDGWTAEGGGPPEGPPEGPVTHRLLSGAVGKGRAAEEGPPECSACGQEHAHT